MIGSMREYSNEERLIWDKIDEGWRRVVDSRFEEERRTSLDAFFELCTPLIFDSNRTVGSHAFMGIAFIAGKWDDIDAAIWSWLRDLWPKMGDFMRQCACAAYLDILIEDPTDDRDLRQLWWGADIAELRSMLFYVYRNSQEKLRDHLARGFARCDPDDFLMSFQKWVVAENLRTQSDHQDPMI